MNLVSFADFARLQILVGRIVRAEASPRAKRPAYKLWIDFGDDGIKISSAQLTTLDGYEIDVPRVVALRRAVDDGPIRPPVSNPERLSKADAEVEQHEDSFEAGSAGQR
jgi:hypothetical protein